jgi:hypothetical protein
VTDTSWRELERRWRAERTEALLEHAVTARRREGVSVPHEMVSALPRWRPFVELVARWHGGALQGVPEEELDGEAPVAVRELYVLAASRRDVLPGLVHHDALEVANGLLALYETEAARWGISHDCLGEDDPPVVLELPYVGRSVESERLTQWALQMAIHELLRGERAERREALAERAEDLRLPLARLGGRWHWPGSSTVFFTGDGALAEVREELPGVQTVFFVADTPGRLAAIRAAIERHGRSSPASP